jgi:hypothetical protein
MSKESIWEKIAKSESNSSSNRSVNPGVTSRGSKKSTTHNDFFDRLSKTDTYASKDMKGQIDKAPKKVNSETRTTVSDLSY